MSISTLFGKTELIYTQLGVAFEALRKAGFIARRGFSCCRGCAGSQLAIDLEAKSEDKRAKVRGAVFYTKQDADHLRKEEDFYLAFGPIHSQKFGKVGEATETIGAEAVRLLRESGVEVSWDGKAETCILVEVKKMVRAEDARERLGGAR